MVEGAILAVIVVFIFLRDWRATVISAIAIPLSAIPAFWFMDLMGFSLNFLSLLALSLVAGVLVDDAIVEIENIVRHMRMGKTPYQAAMDAADEIGLAVVATTMAIVAVFLPVGLMPGISGQFFKNFGFTIVIAVLLSLAVARLITPVLAAYFLKTPKEEVDHGNSRLDPLVHGDPALEPRQPLEDRRYRRAGAMVATVLVFSQLPLTFQPVQNQDFTQVSDRAAAGFDPAAVGGGRRSGDGHPAQARPMSTASFPTSRSARGDIFATLKKDRPMTSVEFERSLTPKLQAIPDARVNFQSQNGGGVSGRDINRSSSPAMIRCCSKRPRVKIVDEMRGLKELRAPRIEGDVRRPEITIKPRFDLAADLGVTTAALSETIRIATLGDIDQNVAKFSLADRQIPIRVALDEEFAPQHRNARRTCRCRPRAAARCR